MAKKYQFAVRLVRASYEGGLASIALSDLAPGREIRVEQIEGTLAEAMEARQKVSASEPRPHAAFVEMADRNAKKAPGLKNVKVIYGGS